MTVTTKTLVGGVVSIFILTGIAYATIAPKMQSELTEHEAENDMLRREESVVQNDRAEADEYEADHEKRDENVRTQEATPTKIEHEFSQVVTKPSVEQSTPPPTQSPDVTDTPKIDTLTPALVATHADKESCWSIIRGNVYDLTTFIGKHPGGERNILKLCGKDGTAFFEDQHGRDAKPEAVLAKFLVGELVP